MIGESNLKEIKYNWNSHLLIVEALGVLETENLPAIDQRNISNIRLVFGKLQQHLMSENLLDEVEDLELLIVSTARLDTFVLKGDHEKYAICISIGMVRAVWNVLLLSLCDVNIFPGYGGENKPCKIRHRISRRMLFGPSVIPVTPVPGRHMGNNKKEVRRYQDISPSRKELCELLFNLVIDYLLYHEAMHVTRDHFAFKKIVDQTDCINESGSAVLKNKMLRFLEVDADLTALEFFIPTNPEYQEFDSLSEFRKADFVFGLMFGNIILQQLFDFQEAEEGVNAQWKQDHPPPLVRSMLFNDLLYLFFTQKKLLPGEVVQDQLEKAWWESGRVAVKLGFKKGHWYGGEMKIIPASKYNKLIKEYNQFQQLIDDSHRTGSYRKIKRFIQRL